MTTLQTIPYEWTEGDQQPEIGFKLPDGLLVSSFTITLEIQRPDLANVSIPATDLGGSTGTFPWAPTDLVCGEGQRSQIKIVNGSTEPETTEDFLIDVKARV